MPISKIKNIVILILLVANIMLLVLLIPLARQRQKQQAQAQEALETLFTQAGVQLNAGQLPDTRPLYTLEFTPDDSGALPAMQALLGEMVLMEHDSTRYIQTYSSAVGSCQLSRGSVLTAKLQNQEPVADLTKDLSGLLVRMGLEPAGVSAPQRVRAGVYRLTAVQQMLEVPVFTAAVTATYENNILTELEGTLYFDTTDLVRTDDVIGCTAADALVAFLGSRDTLGWVGATVNEVEQGYCRADTASAAVVRLVPGWAIYTDTGDFWVNGITRMVSPLVS